MSDTERCDYCSGAKYIIEREGHLSRRGDFYPGLDVGIYGDILFVEGTADTYEPNYIEIGAKIKFCPMCGMSLEMEETYRTVDG